MNNELLKNDDELLREKSKFHYDQQFAEQNEFQNSITSYINRKHENYIKKDYNPKIVNLYKDGLLIINKEEYKLKDFFIVFSSILNNFHLKCINAKFESDKINYNCAVRFIDTTAFINLINNSEIKDNRIIIDNIDSLNDVVKNWDGYIHSEVLETDSIINKKMISYDK